MRYISNTSGKLENVVQAMAEEICSIALNRTIRDGQLTKAKHNIYKIDGNELEFVTNIIPIYCHRPFTSRELELLFSTIHNVISGLDLRNYNDPIGQLNSTDGMLLTSSNKNFSINVINKSDGRFTNCTSRICVYIADIIYLSTKIISNYGPTCIIYDIEGYINFPENHHMIDLPKITDFTAGKKMLTKPIIFSQILGLYAAIENVFAHQPTYSGTILDQYDYLDYDKIHYVKFDELNILKYPNISVTEKVRARIFNGGKALSLADYQAGRTSEPIIGAELPLRCFISGTLIYEHCYALDVYAWTEIYYMTPAEFQKLGIGRYEPHLSPNCPDAENIHTHATTKRWPIGSQLEKNLKPMLSATTIKFIRDGKPIHLFRNMYNNHLIAVSVMVPIKKPVHIIVSPMYDFNHDWIAGYGIHCIKYRTWYPRTAHNVIECMPVTEEERKIMHMLNGTVHMISEPLHGYYFTASGTEFHINISPRDLIKPSIQQYTRDIQVIKCPVIPIMEP
jgi:hypothetical protein